MGAGKTSVGRALAVRLDLPFVDCDEVIAREAAPIPEIFAQSGEAGFRALEREVVLRLLADACVHLCVVALGGGAVLSPEVREALAGFPNVVWLTASVDDLWRRVTSGGEAERPLADDLEAFRARYEERAALYEQVAGARVANGAERDLAAVVDDIAGLLAPVGGASRGGRP
jgi:shikimate kinase